MSNRLHIAILVVPILALCVFSTDAKRRPPRPPQTSADGTEVPPASQIVDTVGAVWTIASDLRILRNGVQANGGLGTVIYWLSQTIYVYGLDNQWWQWTGSSWTPIGTTKPGTVTPPPPPPPPPNPEPSDNIQAAIDAAPEGATIVVRSGIHRIDRALVPKSGQVITGEPGAIISGAHLLTEWFPSGAYWIAAGQIQQGPVNGSPSNGICTSSAPRCGYPEDLFIDNVLQQHVASLSLVAPGRWFFDYSADRIYIAVDPAGHTIETSVTPLAFTGSASDVQIRGLIVEKFATPTQESTINGQGLRWLLEQNEVRWNHAIGVRTNDGGTARSNLIHHNGSMGMSGAGAGILIEGNEIAFNNTVGYNPYWEAGGTKWVFTSGLIVRGNYSHDNKGPGLWTDINNINTLYENNRVEDNDLSGIFHEISYAAVIRNNSVSRNGRVRPSPGWIDGAGILVSGSPDVEVYGNTLVDNYQGITGLEGHRGSGTFGPWTLRNLNVHDNSVTQTGTPTAGTGRSGIIDTAGTGAFSANNWWRHNTYWLPATQLENFIWLGQDVTDTAWRGYGQDVDGSVVR